MILHIPHSKVDIPDKYKKDIFCTKEDIQTLTDHYTDELFSYGYAERMVFGYSRFFCDVERFRYNESMEEVGHGIIYSKGTNNNTIKTDFRDSDTIIEEFYVPHHKNLVKNINKQITLLNNVVIVDCHSFTEKEPSPDFCIGINSYNVPPFLSSIEEYLYNKEYSVGINSPFSGSIIPEQFIDNENVYTFMIEINKKLYMKGSSKSENFINIKNTIDGMLDIVSDFENEE